MESKTVRCPAKGGCYMFQDVSVCRFQEPHNQIEGHDCKGNPSMFCPACVPVEPAQHLDTPLPLDVITQAKQDSIHIQKGHLISATPIRTFKKEPAQPELPRELPLIKLPNKKGKCFDDYRDNPFMCIREQREADNIPYDLALKRIAQLDAEIASLKEKLAEVTAALKADASDLWETTNAIKKEIAMRDWIMEGRGCYAWDDERYREETRLAFEAVLRIISAVQHPAQLRYHQVLKAPGCPVPAKEGKV